MPSVDVEIPGDEVAPHLLYSVLLLLLLHQIHISCKP